MASAGENVTIFRDVVTGSIAQSLVGHVSSWSGTRQCALVNGLQYFSLGTQDARPAVLDQNEGRCWGIVKNKHRVASFTGEIAIVSIEEEDDRLRRIWRIATPLGQTTGVNSQRILSTSDEVQWAVDWAVSPHMRERALDTVCQLSAEELVLIRESCSKGAGSVSTVSDGFAGLRRWGAV
ncbi:MAG: hypothetical protein JWP13_782 [Candidatus Saccharibacteria bacterium]|nr:hypothetical protein [Candidatus Saccharibacteria bacterium]